MNKASTVCKLAFDSATGKYGNSDYNNTYPYNVGRWDGSKWTSDCLGFVHIMANPDNLFSNKRDVLGGGATMSKFVTSSTEYVTLTQYCSVRGSFPNKSLKAGALLYKAGHVGLYIGTCIYNGKQYNSAECASAPSNNRGWRLSWVDLTTGAKYSHFGGTFYNYWLNWGYFNHIDYSSEKPEDEDSIVSKLSYLKLGSTGNEVRNLQALLNLWMPSSTPLVVDGEYFAKTQARVSQYQKIRMTQGSPYITIVDGECGTEVWSDILLT